MHPARKPTAASFVSGTSNLPLLYRTVDEVLKSAVEAGPDRLGLAVPQQSVRLTFAQFDREVERLARGMAACGLKPGERIGIWAPNSAQWLLTMFAAARAGLILVNINPAYRTSELEFVLRLVGCRALVFAPRFKGSDYVAMLHSLIPELRSAAPGRLLSEAFPELRLLIQLGAEPLPGTLSFEDLLASGHDLDETVLASIEDLQDADKVFNIQFTSGTTGTPKGATLTHFNLVNNGFFVGEGMRLSAADRVCIPVPLYHCFGMVLGVLAAMTHNAASVLCGEGFEPLAVLQTVASERCTALHGVPTMFIAELEHPRFTRIRSVFAAHRHHGGLALSYRRNAAGDRRDAHAGGDDLLRHDGDKSGELPEPARRSPASCAWAPSVACIRMSRSRSSTRRVASRRAERPASS